MAGGVPALKLKARSIRRNDHLRSLAVFTAGSGEQKVTQEFLLVVHQLPSGGCFGLRSSREVSRALGPKKVLYALEGEFQYPLGF